MSASMGHRTVPQALENSGNGIYVLRRLVGHFGLLQTQSPGSPKEKLNQFYDIYVREPLGVLSANHMATVEMFSDSLLFYGDDLVSGLEQLHPYMPD